MKKLHKIFLNILSCILLLVVVLSASIPLVLSLDSVHNYILHKASKFATDYMQSPVEIGKIKFHSLHDIELSDIYVQDVAFRDTLLYVQQLEVGVGSWLTIANGLDVGYARLRNGEFALNQYKDSITNIKYIIGKIRNNRPPNPNPSNYKINIDYIELDDLAFRYRKYIPRDNEYGVDYTNLYLRDICAIVNNFEVNGSEITASVESMALNEDDNVSLNMLSIGDLYLSPDRMTYNNIYIDIDNSWLGVSLFEMKYDNWTMGDFINKIPMRVDVDSAKVDFRDVAKFTANKRKWKSQVEFSSSFEGTVSDFGGELRYLRTLGTSVNGCSYSIKGLPDIDKTIFDFDVTSAYTNIKNIHQIVNDFANKSTLEIAKTVEYKPSVRVAGSFNGSLNRFVTSGILTPVGDVGSGSFDLKMAKQRGKTELEGKLIVDNLNIGEIIGDNSFGAVSASVDIETLISDSSNVVNGMADISAINILDRDLSDISVALGVQDNKLSADLECRDSMLNFVMNGYFDHLDATPSYNLYVDIFDANMPFLGMTHQKKFTNLSADVIINGQGLSLDSLSLHAKVDNLMLVDTLQVVDTLSSLDVRVNLLPEVNYISLNSNMLDVTLRGVMGIDKVSSYLKQSVSTYLPVISSDSLSQSPELTQSESLSDSYYIAQVNLKHQSSLIHLLVPDLDIADGSWVRFMFNPHHKNYSLNGDIPYISYKGNMASKVSVSSLNNMRDSLFVYLSAEEVLYSNQYIPDVSIHGSLSSDNITFSAGFEDKTKDLRFLLRSSGSVNRSATERGVSIDMTLLPSYYRLGSKQWNLYDGGVKISKGRVVVDSLQIISDNEQFLANGVLSSSEDESLKLDMNNFDLSLLSKLLERLGFTFGGMATGSAEVIGALSKSNIHIIGDIDIDSLAFNGSKLGNQNLQITRDSVSRRNLVLLTNRTTQNQLATGYLDWIGPKYSFDIAAKGVDPVLISPFLKGIAYDVEGSCDATLNLSNINSFNKFMLNGAVRADSLRATIDFTKVRYTVSGDMDIKDSRFVMNGASIRDSLGGSGSANLMMYLNPIGGFEFNIDVEARELLALNTKQRDNSMFYGSVFGTGNINIQNSASGVDFTGSVATAKHSRFFLPLSYNSNISEADFIRFVDKGGNSDQANPLWELYKNRRAVKASSDFNLRLDMKVLNNTTIDIVIDPLSGSSINSVGSGDFTIAVNPRREIFNINGLYTIQKGTYRFIMPNFNIVDKIFTIENGGWIRFDGDPLDARLDVDAIYKVKASIAPLVANETSTTSSSARVDVDCRMNIKDELLQPTIELGVDVLNTDPETTAIVQSALNTPEQISNQFIFLLLTNSFMANDSGSSTNAGLMGGVVTGIEYLSNRIKDVISSDSFDFSINYMPRSTTTSDELSLGVSAPLYKDVLFLDVKGNYNFKNNSAAIASDNLSSLSGEFYLTWVINNSGNLRLKGFSRTINTFDENQGLQESGVGIYYKEEFDTISELKTKYKAYFAERKRRKAERKAARKIIREAKDKEREAKRAAKLAAK